MEKEKEENIWRRKIYFLRRGIKMENICSNFQMNLSVSSFSLVENFRLVGRGELRRLYANITEVIREGGKCGG